MFYNKELKELQDIYDSLQNQYLKLRKKYWKLIEELDRIDRQDDKIAELEELIEKLSKELEYKTWVVTQYILKYPEYMEVLEKKHARIKKRTSKKFNDDSGEVEL